MKNLIYAAITMVLIFSACCNQKQSNMNPTFLELAEQRFSVRKYAPTPVEQDKIDKILRAAQVAPTARNNQPQRIYVLKSEEAIAKINQLSKSAYHAPVVFMVCYDVTEAWTNSLDNNTHSGEMDATIVGTHMMLEAAEQGLATCWVKNFNPKEVAEAFDIPSTQQVSFLIDCGYADENAKPAPMHSNKKEIIDFVKEL